MNIQETHDFQGVGIGHNGTFPMKARIKIVSESYEDDDGKRQERDSVILLPEEGTVRDFFYSTWWPKHPAGQELLIDVGYPISLSVRRVCFSVPDYIYSKSPYLYVMDLDLKHELLKLAHKSRFGSRTVSISVLPGRAEMDY